MDPPVAEQIAYYRPRGRRAGARVRTRNDGVFFGFFLSHVPEDRFDAFWDLVTRALGWDVAVSTAGPFYWGNGSVSSQETHRDGADTGSR